MPRRQRLPDRHEMVLTQLRARGIDDERVLAAMEKVPRELFVPDVLHDEAYADAALPIGFEQTISQPYMVARICAELQLHGYERVLDVGTGSGYQAAVLAELADEVHSIEVIRALAEHARVALAAAGYAGRVHLHVGDGSRGVPEHAPFHAIAVAAAAREPPPALLDQLFRGGRLAIPIGTPQRQLLRVYVATPEGAADFAAVPCRFVPLVSNR
jgi:protein-L-isoaspartate(D-aspartate) O-methyltransferase